MSDIAIQVQGLGKQYFLGGQQNRYGKTLRESLTDAFAAPFRKRVKKERTTLSGP